MTRRRWLVVATAVLAVAGGAGWWVLGRGGGAATGAVRLEWRGSFRGRATIPATIAWCPVTRVATLEAIRNDTGFIATLHETDSLVVGPHPVVGKGNLAATMPKPGAIAALRYVRDTATILGFEATSGLLTLDAAGTRADGAFQIRMQRPFKADTVIVRGDFRGVPVVASAVGCP